MVKKENQEWDTKQIRENTDGTASYGDMTLPLTDRRGNAARFEYFLNSAGIAYNSISETDSDIIYLEHKIENGPNVSLGIMLSSDNTGIRLYLFNYIRIDTTDGVLATLGVINKRKSGCVCFIDEDRDVILQMDIPILQTFSVHTLYKLCEYMFAQAEQLYLPLMKELLTQTN